MLWSMLLLAAAGLASASLAAEETRISKPKLNRFDPVLSSSAYIGRIKENERLVQLEPRLFATDVDASNSPNGRICGYELSPHKHDDAADQTGSALPFAVEWSNGEPVITLQPGAEQVDCEIKQIYRMFIRAFDCAEGNHRRYSERSSMVITVDDVNEYPPVFTHTNYLFKLYHDQVCASCRVEATDDDCANGNHRVCDYQIRTADVPFSIDSNGSISITKALSEGKYEFDVVAVDCHAKSANASDKPMSEPARVTIQVVKSCKPTITDENPSKLTIHSDHTHIFDTAHVEACDETCAVESITSTVTLDANGIESGCAAEQCPVQNREYVLIPKDDDYSVPPQSRFMSFDGARHASIVQKADFSGEFKDTFTIRMWMKHDDEDYDDKEHIFCKSDKTYKNRHITALLLHNGYLRLVMRKGPLPSNDQNVYASEWMWKLPQLSDDVWHSYRLFVNYPEKVDLYVDNRLISPTASDSEIVEDFALTSIDGTDGTVFAVGACWHGRVSRMVQHFHGQLSGLSIEQQEEQTRPGSCYQECGQFLDIPDIQADSSLECTSNSDRSVWTVRTDSSESFEQLLKHIVYRNTFDPIGPSGQRTVSIQTAIKCLGENFTYNLPTFSRRLAIDEKIRPTVIELKGDTNLLVPEATLNQGVYLFRNLSIFTDAIKKDQVDISDCSINTIPDLSSDERFIVPDEQLDMNNIRKDHTQTGLVLSGSGTIDTYQSILQQIAFLSKSPAKILDRSFLLVCIGAQEQVPTNEIRLRLHVEKQIAPPAPSAAVASNKLYVDNDAIRDNLFDLDSGARTADGLTGWPIAIGVCVSVSIAGVLILYLIVHIRSAGKQRQSSSRPDADMHPQMEWEDDIGLNIIVNPLEETKKSAPPMHMSNADELMPEYEGTSSEDDGDDDDDEGSEHSPNDYSSDEDDTYASNQIHAKQHQHQLEWDDEAMEYGPKKV